jgi:hypothetical protein
MRTEEEIRTRRNTDHYEAEVHTEYLCNLDGWLCEQDPSTFPANDGVPDCYDCEKHQKWVLNDKEEK